MLAPSLADAKLSHEGSAGVAKPWTPLTSPQTAMNNTHRQPMTPCTAKGSAKPSECRPPLLIAVLLKLQ
eukprot:5435100-Prymnesium_polylepis.1